jgi:spore maturation protein CgeB
VNQGSLSIVVLGLSITSSWGNGHATTYRALLSALAARGHRILFLERDVPWYASHRDMRAADYARIEIYCALDELLERFSAAVRTADCVIVGSYVPDGVAVGEWVTDSAAGATAFYDIDTPITLNQLDSGACKYLTADLIPLYDIYLSFTGGPSLSEIKTRYGASQVEPLYCAVDPDSYRPLHLEPQWNLGYLGTYSVERQSALEELLIEPATASPARRFVVAGPQYPPNINWPANVERIEHLPPCDHCSFYNRQLFTLNVTRAEMISRGYSPSVRLFEAAACGTPIISDYWPGLETFFEPEKEILIADSASAVLEYLQSPAREAQLIGRRARERVLAEHTAAHRAEQLERYIIEAAPLLI